MKHVLNQSKAGKGAQDFLKKLFNNNSKKFAKAEKDLKKEETDLLAKKNVLSEDDYKKNDQAYLINFTAAWCITCQANDKIALSRPSVVEYMSNNNINYVVADWTNRDKEILDVLNIYGRSGVPLYVFWKPGMDKSIVLPAILTESLVLDTIRD